jgi:hypothetical protein
MPGTENLITLGDPKKIEVKASWEVSFSIVPCVCRGREKRNTMYFGSPDAGNPLVGWERAKASK